MDPKQPNRAHDWLDAGQDGEFSLPPEDKRLASQLRAMGRADEPDFEFTAHLANRLTGMAKAAAKPERAQTRKRSTFREGMQRAWQWGVGLAGIALLVGVLVFSMSLLPRSAGAPGPAQPSLAGPVFTPLPGGPTATLPPQTYIVQEGDTWASIASTFGLSVQELLALNGMSDGSEQRVGQTLVVGPAAVPSVQTDSAHEPTEAPAVEPIPAMLVQDACQLSPQGLSNLEHYPPSQRPEALAGGGFAESGEFTFEIWLACSPTFNRENTLGDHYTEIEELGFISYGSYAGLMQEGHVTQYTGIQPYVREAGSGNGALGEGYAFGEIEGLQFPVGIIPDFSQADTRLRYMVKVKTPDGAYAGAALAFTLQREAEGYRPVDIQVEPLPEDELKETVYDPAAPAPFPTKDPESVYPELKEMREMLDHGQAPLLDGSGWLHFVTRQEEPGGNGLYGSLTEWTTEDWYQIDERGFVVAFVTIQRADDGRILQQVYSHEGETVNLTFGGRYPFTPYRFERNAGLFSDLFQLLKANQPVRREEAELEGSAVWVWVLPYMESGRIQREFFDQASGARRISEVVDTTPDGKEELVWRYTYEVAERAEPTAEILDLLGQEFQGYVPPVPEGTPVPQGFDPSNSELTSRSIPGDSFERPNQFFGDIFAGDYLLGRVDFGARPDGNCDRSADGSKLAFTYEVAEGERLSSATLRWLDLRDIPRVFEVAPELQLFGRVFWSPVSDQIAFSACTGLVDNRYQGCGTYLYDLPRDETRQLTDAGATVWDILWKPDGTQIAFVSTVDESHTYFVLDAGSGDIVDQGLFDVDAWQFPASAPVNDWGVSYPQGYEGSRCFMNP